MNYTNPFNFFTDWYAKARESSIDKPNAMVLSTLASDNMPTSRVVLLSSFDSDGFIFHTNYGSQKADQLKLNASASLLFWWDELGYQIRIQGQVRKTSALESDEYFAGRPRGSQIGAWASRQSVPVSDREKLEQEVTKYTRKFEGGDVVRPEFWGGYQLKPNFFEFWINRESRLHDRIEFQLKNNEWHKALLAP